MHGLILLYEKEFQIAALRNTESERTVGNVSTSITATGWIHVSIEPSELETSFEKEPKPPPRNSHPNSSHPHHGTLTKSQSPPTFSGSSGSNGDRFLDTVPRKNTVDDSTPTLNSLSSKSFYTNVWKGMIFLASDPNPSVAQMAQHVVHSVHDKVCYILL